MGIQRATCQKELGTFRRSDTEEQEKALPFDSVVEHLRLNRNIGENDITLIMPMTSAPHQMRNRRRSRTASHPSICSSLRARRLKRGKRAANQYTGKSPSVKRVSKAIFTLEILSRGATTALDAGTRTTFLSLFSFFVFSVQACFF